MNMVIAIACGGAFGAVSRYLVMMQVGQHGAEFPYGTLTVNVLGSTILGIFIEVSALSWSPSPEIRALLVVGVLGAFTTFSTFSLDVVYLVQKGAVVHAGLYVAASIIISIGALYASMRLIRLFLA
ncbi:MAG: fluoride efflux transporter CrcB [Rhodospirillales bacterium]|jgi:CrcB protein